MARHFENWLKAYMAYTAATEPPAIFNYWVGVSTIAAALQGKVYLGMGLFEWTPTSYIILVGPSGCGKSSAIHSGMNLLRQVKGIHFGSDTLTWQAMIDELLATTVTRGKGTQRRHSSITYAVDELGTFLNPRDNKLMSSLTKIWGGDGGQNFSKSTRGEGLLEVMRPQLNLLAGATPSWISDNFPPSLIGTGFTSRCILVYAAAKQNLIAYPKRAAQQQGLGDMAKMARLLTEDLREIAKLQGEVTLSEEAYARGTAWYEACSHHPPVGLAPENFSGYLQRRQAHMHKLALALSAATGDSLVVEASHLDEAIMVLESTERAMPEALSGMRDEMRPQIRLEEVLRKYGTVAKIDLFARFKNRLDWRDFEKIVVALTDAGMVAEIITPSGRALRWLGTQPKDSLPS